MSGLIKTWFPNHFDLYTELQVRLDIKQYLFSFIFDDSPFCGTSFNAGPVAVARYHLDMKNLVTGICAIGVFGKFNHKTSGHIILKEAKVILEVMDGDLVVIPSAAVNHRNSGLREGEWRSSIVQYTNGGLFRWIWHNGLKGKVSASQALADAEEGKRRWEEGWSLFPTFSGLKVACETGRLPRMGVRDRIEQGLSLLLPKRR